MRVIIVLVALLAAGCTADPNRFIAPMTKEDLLRDLPQRMRDAHTVRFTSRRSDDADRAPTTGALRWDGDDLDLSTDDGAGATVLLDGVVYDRLPPTVDVTLPEGKTWVRSDRAATDRFATGNKAARDALPTWWSPTRGLDRAGDQVALTERSDQPLDNEHTTRYTFGHQDRVYRLWIDDRGLPVRVEVDRAAQDGSPVTDTTDYRDWGGAVAIDAPPADLTCGSAEVQF
ncbi:hypothetical protein ABZ816_04380 [Actinosynnema sp. NPDC047251]|uniref:Lipoprotein n=1 Tax=Saccharothrix espanaensis (strain ATCC 51144 / DSM 44229 / JCM 9112 / NBRC 15066 / NRRL 15764) TaxID=1179773 RepID=K0JZH3_SACES|nr:hypothetical protein [Saccharothrix espanaensis]CCH31501.1 hypothetical protein BN6_42140 [Saccharothrix espanaensis DSM 44229]